MTVGLLALNDKGEAILRMFPRDLMRKINLEKLENYVFQTFSNAMKEVINIVSYEGFSIYGIRSEKSIIALISEGRRKGLKATVMYIAELIKQFEHGKRTLNSIKKEINRKMFLRKIPNVKLLYKVIKKTIRTSEEKEQKTYPERIKPYSVVDFRDGLKRGLVACYAGDLIEAYKLVLGALERGDISIGRLFAAYLGLQLISLPPNYPAPRLDEVKELIKKVKVENILESISLSYLRLLLGSFTSFKKHIESRNYIISEMDSLFKILQEEKDILVKDIIAYLLATSEPYFLSRKKADFLLKYVRERSPIIGSYVWASLSRSRTIGSLYTGKIPLEDILGMLRELRSRFFTAKNEFQKVIGDSKAEKRALIRLAFVTEEFARALYWFLTLEGLRIDVVKDVVEQLIFLQMDGLQIIIEKKPPVPLRVLFDTFYTIFLNYHYAKYVMNLEEIGTLEYGLLTIGEKIYETLLKTIKTGRFSADMPLKIATLAWIISYLSMKTRRESPILHRLLGLLTELNSRKVREISRVSFENYLVYLGSVGMALLNVLIENPKLRERDLRKVLNFVTEVAEYILLRGLYAPIFTISILKSIQNVLEKVETGSDIKERLRILKKALSNEDLNELEWKALEDIMII
ncbi:MAG: hypothetical protein ACTSX9_03235 [Candidatus Njordarchaeales archaeon]